MTTKRTRTESPSASRAAQEQLSELVNWQSSALGAVTNAGQAYANGLAAINQEMASFLQTRLQHDIELGESLARCRTLADATKVHSDWLKQVTDDYAAETRRLVEIGSGLMRESWRPVEQSTLPEPAEKPAASGSQPDR